MPYAWTDTPRATRLTLWPHRSLPRHGFAAVILGMYLFITIPLFGLIGTAIFWGILPFALGAVGFLWWGIQSSYRDGEVTEELTLTDELAHLVRREPDGAERQWQSNRYWARAVMHERGGPVPHYVTLKGAGREVEIGAFLSEDERKALFGELASALSGARPHG